MHTATLALTLVALASPALSTTYTLSANVVGADFYNAFVFEAIRDPTKGRVEYVDAATAKANNLTFASGDTFILRGDYTNVVPASGTGRQSVRIQTSAKYTTHVGIWDVRHMPEGCGTWPSIWETGTTNWPNLGEVDILENVNDQSPNHMTLHTGKGCTIPSTSNQTGKTLSTNCDANVAHNTGCRVASPTKNSFGPEFNRNGGGWYAIERTTSFIKVWFWPRNGSPPSDVSSGGKRVNTKNWGIPAASFPSTSCDFNTWGEHVVRINLDFCGSFAGTQFTKNGCPGSCTTYVDNNPEKFVNAYFDIAAMRIYT